MNRTREEARQQEVWLSRARPPTSQHLPWILTFKTKDFGILLPSKKTGDVWIATNGTWVVTKCAAYAI